MTTTVELPKYKPKDFTSDQEIRWCPGCGDYAILAALKKMLPNLGHAKENYVFVSGIGCSSRFPYYMNTYGMHSIHGRAPAVATGIKSTNPNLQIWIITGDGDGLSIGGNHLLHAIRRNMDINILLFNNRIYGLTKGQYSPTSEQGKKTKSSPAGSIDIPLKPVSFALGAGATFVARCTDVNRDGLNLLPDVLRAAGEHKGTSFIEIYQDCNVFNHGAFSYATEKGQGRENSIPIEHGKPMIFGKDMDMGVRLNGTRMEVVNLKRVNEDDLLYHDETDLSIATILSQMTYPELPEPMGIFRRIERPTYGDQLSARTAEAFERYGDGDLEELLGTGDTWVVE